MFAVLPRNAKIPVKVQDMRVQHINTWLVGLCKPHQAYIVCFMCEEYTSV